MDIIAGIFELLGLWIVGNKNKLGFLFSILGALFWIGYVFISNSTYGLLIVTIPATIINIRNFYKWKK